jgi:hypothetical protein
MKNTYQFITHVVNNLFYINEYSDAEINRLMEKFKEEADDFNITISDEQLKKYIERFDQLKNSPKVQEKDLRKWSLSNLIKLITSSEGAEVETEKQNQTPDVIYDESGYVIWNGSKEGNCITYGAGEKWCITRGSFGTYRYSKDRGYPTFYLVKNENLPSTNKLSFVAIQVRDVDEENKRYVYTNRQNSPYESNPMSFSGLTSEVPWLNDIPNIKSLLKYIPLSSQEKSTQLYKREAISIREWLNFPFSEKKQYLVVRSNSNLFSDITNSEFISNYLPKYPQIATFIAVSPGVLPSELLLKNLDKFSNNDRKSITANLRNLIDLGELKQDTLPFDVKKLLTILNKWNIANNERIYVTKNGEAIVKLTFEGGEVKVGVFTAENDYPNIKLNKRTSKFLLDYPELDKIPFNSLLKLAKDEVIDKDIINRVLQSAEKDPDSAIVVKDTEDGKIILDSNTFTSYKVEGDKIVQIPFDNEEVQNILSSEEDNGGFQESAVDLVFSKKDLPPQIERDSFINILKSTPYDKRTKGGMVTIPLSNNGILVFPTDLYTRNFNNSVFRYGIGGSPWNQYNSYMGNFTDDMYKAYFNYLRSKNLKYTDDQIAYALQGTDMKEFIAALPPMVDNSVYKPATDGETSYLVNTRNPRESKMVSRLRKLIKANLSPAQAQRLLGTTTQTPTTQTPGAQEPAAQTPVVQTPAGAPRRGRPAGVAGVARPAAAPVAGGTPTTELMNARGLETAFNGLPRAVRARLTTAVQENGISRGASRRNNQLGGRGRVGSTWNSGPSSIYFIRLNNGTTIASINIQPGNGNYILIPGREPIRLNSPTELLSALQARDLAEVLIAEFMVSNPTKLTETKKILNYYIKSKNRKK